MKEKKYKENTKFILSPLSKFVLIVQIIALFLQLTALIIQILL